MLWLRAGVGLTFGWDHPGFLQRNLAVGVDDGQRGVAPWGQQVGTEVSGYGDPHLR